MWFYLPLMNEDVGADDDVSKAALLKSE